MRYHNNVFFPNIKVHYTYIGGQHDNGYGVTQ